MPRFRVLLTDYAWPDLDIEHTVLAEIDAELVVAPNGEAATLQSLAADVDAIMTNWARVPAEVLEVAQKCRIVSRLGIGLDNIDVASATARGMLVTNIPDYCLIEVAEHTLALVLALGRKIAFYHRETKEGRYRLTDGPPLRRLAGQTLGIVGFGNIGRAVAARASAFGFRVLACRRQPSVRPADAPAGVEFCSFDELLAASDYVSLHVPSTPATRHMIGAEQFARMKSTAYLINTARGAVMDEAALAAALSAGELAGAALDVQQQEPPDLNWPPFNDPRVIVTPHAAFYSLESVNDLRRRVSRQVVQALQGNTPENVVNR